MYKGVIRTGTAVLQDMTIPFDTVYNTNNNTIANKGVVNLVSTGYYDIDAQVTVEDYDGDTALSLQLYANGEPVAETIDVIETGATNTDPITLSITDVKRVLPANLSLANVSLQLSSNATVTSGVFIVKKVR